MPDSEPTSARLESLRARWESDDKGSRVFLQLADEYRRLGRNADAAEVLEQGLEANPSHPAARVALGRCRLELGQTADAVRELETVIESDPTQMVAYRLLVEAYLREGRAELARQRLRVYSLLNDSDPEIADLRRRIGEIRPAEAAEPVRAASPAVAESEPFPALLAGHEDRRRYLAALATGGLFELPPPPEEPAEVAPAQEPGPPPAVAETPEEWEAAPVAEAPIEAPVGEPAPPPSAPTGTPASPPVFDLGAPSAAPPADLTSLLDREAAPPAEEPAARGPEEPPPPAEEPSAAPETRGRATVTLGRLYLRQGHLGEAESIFREVLEREPDNTEARRGLQEVALHERPELQAAELLGGYGGELRGEGLTDRKRYVLERYLERLRRGGSGDVH